MISTFAEKENSDDDYDDTDEEGETTKDTDTSKIASPKADDKPVTRKSPSPTNAAAAAPLDSTVIDSSRTDEVK